MTSSQEPRDTATDHATAADASETMKTRLDERSEAMVRPTDEPPPHDSDHWASDLFDK